MVDKQHSAELYVSYLTAINSSQKNQNTPDPVSNNEFEALASAAGRALAALRAVGAKRCACCTREFRGISRAKYCSDECRMKSWRKSRKTLKPE